MKAKKGFNLRNVCGEQLIVAEGKENIDFSNIISKETFSEKDLVELITAEYDVDQETALKDCRELIRQWHKAGIIED